jgi:general secretion pathway protein I
MGPMQRGYTLIEVLVAFAVLAGALTLLLGILTGSSRQVRWADEASRAALHAQSLLDDTGVGEALQPGQRAGEFEEGRYRWSLAVDPWRDPALPPDTQPLDPGAPRLLRLVLEVRWGEGGPRERLQLQSLRLVTPDPLQGDAP